MTEDPKVLYVQQVEQYAETDSSAGLGYLTMVTDSGAELAWRFEEVGVEGVAVTTEVTIAV